MDRCRQKPRPLPPPARAVQPSSIPPPAACRLPPARSPRRPPPLFPTSHAAGFQGWQGAAAGGLSLSLLPHPYSRSFREYLFERASGCLWVLTALCGNTVHMALIVTTRSLTSCRRPLTWRRAAWTLMTWTTCSTMSSRCCAYAAPQNPSSLQLTVEWGQITTSRTPDCARALSDKLCTSPDCFGSPDFQAFLESALHKAPCTATCELCACARNVQRASHTRSGTPVWDVDFLNVQPCFRCWRRCEDWVHRTGRTGRAGKTGAASHCTPNAKGHPRSRYSRG